MESIHSQANFGLRTTDFLDFSSEDESTHVLDRSGDAPNVDLFERRASAAKKKKNRKSSPTIDGFVSQCGGRRPETRRNEDGYERLRTGTAQEETRFAETPGTSYNGSVEGLLPGFDNGSLPHMPSAAFATAGRPPRSTGYSYRDSSIERQSPMPASKVDQILGAHAIAHEITLQALMRDEDALDRSLQSFAPVQPSERGSLLPASLRLNDPRSPRDRTFSTPLPAGSKKVQVLPPPIDTSATKRSLPADLVRTPYPSTPDRVHRKNHGRSSPLAVPNILGAAEDVLTLSIRRSSSYGVRRVTSLTIPAGNDFGALGSRVGEKAPQPTATDFDDEQLFKQLRLGYRELGGFLRFLSARSLARIVVSGPATKRADAGYGWLHQPRSPRSLAYRGLSDTFSEERIMQHYRKPRLGRSRYAFVHWAHRLAGAPPVQTPQGDDDVEGTPTNREPVRKMEQPEGLEFVLGWSVPRISLSLVLVLVLSVAAALLWVFLGHNTVPSQPSEAGYRGAGDRVGTGALLGICVLLVGLSGMTGWMGVSWLVM